MRHPYRQTASAVLRELRVHEKEGLSQREASKRNLYFGENSLLKKEHLFWKTEPSFQVKRGGTSKKIVSSSITIGDIVEIQAGEIVPADMRILHSRKLLVQEVSVTGHSRPTLKDSSSLTGRLPLSSQKNMLFTGTTVTFGSGIGVVTAIGGESQFGKLRHIISSPKISRVKKLKRSNETAYETMALCLEIEGVITTSKTHPSHIDFLQGSLLPLDKNKNLSLPEELAQTALSLEKDSSATSTWQVRSHLMYSSTYHYGAVQAHHPTQSSSFIFVTGSPEVLLEKSTSALTQDGEGKHIESKRRREIAANIDQLAQKGPHLLGIAFKRVETTHSLKHSDIHGLTLLGVLVSEEEVRKNIHSEITKLEQENVAIKFISHGSALGAQAMLRQAGIPLKSNQIYTGQQLQHVTDHEMLSLLPSARLFAQLEPLDKERLVRLLQKKGFAVAVTGKGIDDIVALKSADIGLALPDADNTVQEAADINLSSNTISEIAAAVKKWKRL